MGAVRLPMVLRHTNYGPQLAQINGQLTYADAGEASVTAMDARVDDSGAPAPASTTQPGIR